MSSKDMTKDLASLSGANLLDHYLDSVKTQLQDITDPKNQPDLLKKKKLELQKELPNLRNIAARCCADRHARMQLIHAISVLRDQLDEEHEYYPYTKTCVRNLEKAIDYAITASFGLKEDIQNSALISVLKNTQILKNRSLIPQSYFDYLQKIKEETE